ncbi:MAG: D-glycero-beta-D-manno-heptose-1,7-bisphosphate 7-phosphatase [Gammaproteobacteria bacterium]|nr:MAG: D-glycero-beta-D-manno-heptose-1,7-bisphosphate 7-phosphatase [Gammaproteobacteria bacterium]
MSLIILGRDGVINHDLNEAIISPAEWEPIEGSLEAIARLNHAGYRVIVSTHQPGIEQGLLDVDTLTRIHSKMRRMLAQVGGKIEAILYCPHDSEQCECQRSQGGAYLELANRLRIDLNNVISVSSHLASIASAQAVAIKPLLVKTGKESFADELDAYNDLSGVADALLKGDI